MSQYTAVIDIGSNSVRLVIYKSRNKHEFHIAYEDKFKVRIGEGAYLRNGYLQQESMQRAYDSLQTFVLALKQYPISKIVSVATSALRDAPNQLKFIEWIKKDFHIKIEVISGKEEARLGALAALYLLPIDNAITIDIGGGSADLAIIKNSKIVDTYSLNLGTVRLKELFSQQNTSTVEINDYIQNELASLPAHFTSTNAIGIGGTARTLSKAIMYFKGSKKKNIHNFRYNIKRYQDFFEKIINSSNTLHKELKISKNRIDTISEGTLIWKNILERIEAKNVISSAVGLREGLFLEHIFKDNLKEGVTFTPLTD